MDPETAQNILIRIDQEIQRSQPRDAVLSLFDVDAIGDALARAGFDAYEAAEILLDILRNAEKPIERLAAWKQLLAWAREAARTSGLLVSREVRREIGEPDSQSGRLVAVQRAMSMLPCSTETNSTADKDRPGGSGLDRTGIPVYDYTIPEQANPPDTENTSEQSEQPSRDSQSEQSE